MKSAGRLKALLLSAPFGDGHRQVANALREAFVACGVDVHEIDSYRQSSKALSTFSQWSYEWFTRYTPWLYGASYWGTANWTSKNPLWKFLTISTNKGLLDTVKMLQPDIVLQLYPDHALSKVRKLVRGAFTGVVVTDFSVHSHWFPANVDAFYIPHGDLREPMSRFVEQGVPLIDSGIPVREQFQQLVNDAPSMVEQPYVLVATGGRGLFRDLDDVIQTLLLHLPQHHVYVLCGRNTSMLADMEKRHAKESRLHGVAYLQDVAQWFQHADFAIIKSGGLTVSECLTARCPMIFYRPEPGQEADNARFLAQEGAGRIVKNSQMLSDLLGRADFVSKLPEIQAVCDKVARPKAAQTIVEHVLQQVGYCER